MKLKLTPEDFQVDELPAAPPQTVGRFTLYQLSKRSIGTPEAIREISRAWRLHPRQVSYGGLKDRHALTTQRLTIEHGPNETLKGKLWTLEPLGRMEEAFAAKHFAGNRFRIVLRDLSKPDVSRIRVQLEQVSQAGVANYFDEQRFRSVGRGGQFIARALIAGDFEAALKLALAEPYEHDRAENKNEKAQLRKNWGDWPLLAASLPKLGPANRAVRHLADAPGDFKGAFTQTPAELQSLYISAYQSHLWNRMLGRFLCQALDARERCFIELGKTRLPMPRKLPAEKLATLTALELPLPSARLHLAAEDPLLPLYETALAEEKLTLAEMKLQHLREPFFSKGARPALFRPGHLTEEKARDDLHAGRWKSALAFDLPRGCYATMLVKRLTGLK